MNTNKDQRVLVIGGGGREHAICDALRKSKRIRKLYCAPGNGGIAQIATCVDLKPTDISGIIQFSKENAIDYVVVAPDDPLALGLVDALEAEGIRAFGPNKAAARIEASKAFAKQLMLKYGLPTAKYVSFTDADEAETYAKASAYPIVVKADGLALGKGVIICETFEQAKQAIDSIMRQRVFGSSGDRIIIEEFISGPEVSVLTFTDGKTIVPMKSAQDHKRAYDNDKGPNTGGMGTFAPSQVYTQDIARYFEENIMKPTMEAMRAEGCPFKGVLYFGLMLTKDGPKVLEYNARFGDPETQVVLPLLETDLFNIMEAITDERLQDINITWRDGAAVCVVLASGGYPGSYEKGKRIYGLDSLNDADCFAFHAGTACGTDGEIVTSGGRVLGITAVSDDLPSAIRKAYTGVKGVSFEGMEYRTDIGRK